MWFPLAAFTILPAAFFAAAAKFTPASTALTDALAAKALANLVQYEATHGTSSSCNTRTAYVRKDWDTFTAAEKKDYIAAVLKLHSLPSSSGDFAPGAKSRYDDFVAVHINQTLTIHTTVRL
jgi:tyrosinase